VRKHRLVSLNDYWLDSFLTKQGQFDTHNSLQRALRWLIIRSERYKTSALPPGVARVVAVTQRDWPIDPCFGFERRLIFQSPFHVAARVTTQELSDQF